MGFKKIYIEESRIWKYISQISSALTFLHDNGLDNRLHRIGIPDQFVEHATRDELLVELGLCPENIISVLKSENVGEEVYEL
mgnify:CR=1 FL=1